MRPGRVYNGVDRVPVQFVVIGWRIGLVTAGLIMAMVAVSFFLVTIHLALGITAAAVSLAVFAWTVRVVHKSDPHHALSELTVYRLVIFGTRARYLTNH